MSPQTAVLAPIIVLAFALGFDAFCLLELSRSEVVLRFPHRIWVLIILCFTPFGGMAYLMLGKSRP